MLDRRIIGCPLRSPVGNGKKLIDKNQSLWDLLESDELNGL